MKKGGKSFGSSLGTIYGKKGLIILIIILLIIAIAGYFLLSILLFPSKVCEDEECFFNGISNCDKVSWIKEDSQSAWSYKILGSSSKTTCKVEVKLIKLKQGTIEFEKLGGEKMICDVDKGSSALPEKTLSKCTGVLKEQMQEIIIQKMHDYLLKNIGQIEEGFEEI